MRVLVAYATTEGQTRKIARHLADRLADAGRTVELMSLDDAEGIDLQRFDRAILAASVHASQYQKALTSFAAEQAEALNRMPTLFLSVSLSAAGHDAEDWRALGAIAAELEQATGWTPGQTAQVAGAYMPSRYDVFRRFIMRRIVAERDPGHDPARDRDYTDWPALGRLVDGWMDGAP